MRQHNTGSNVVYHTGLRLAEGANLPRQPKQKDHTSFYHNRKVEKRNDPRSWNHENCVEKVENVEREVKVVKVGTEVAVCSAWWDVERVGEGDTRKGSRGDGAMVMVVVAEEEEACW
ncbi:hypothetical protein E2542_SST04740 [Spatholobus suberectus]|nr:hypothetical protein E2542_SST04740 [Spatholobus suberectus]